MEALWKQGAFCNFFKSPYQYIQSSGCLLFVISLTLVMPILRYLSINCRGISATCVIKLLAIYYSLAVMPGLMKFTLSPSKGRGTSNCFVGAMS